MERDLHELGERAIVGRVPIRGLGRAAMRAKLRRFGVRLNGYGDELLDAVLPERASEPASLSTVCLSVRDLGFAEGAILADLFAGAAEFGLDLCPIRAAADIRLHMLDQPRGPRLTIASRRVCDDPDRPCGFYLQHRADGLWLRGYKASPCHVWSTDEVFCFCEADPVE